MRASILNVNQKQARRYDFGPFLVPNTYRDLAIWFVLGAPATPTLIVELYIEFLPPGFVDVPGNWLHVYVKLGGMDRPTHETGLPPTQIKRSYSPPKLPGQTEGGIIPANSTIRGWVTLNEAFRCGFDYELTEIV